MTVSGDTNRSDHQGDAATRSFVYDFLVLQADDLQVYLDGIIQVGGYTISNIGVPTGGNVIFTTAPASGVAIALIRRTVADQLVDYISGDKFPAQVLEAALDKLTVLAQDLRAEVENSLRLPPFELSPPSTRLPAADDRKGKFLAFALGDGAPFATDAQITGILVSSAMETVVQAATLAAGRAALGVGGLAEANTWAQPQTLAALLVSGNASIGGTLGLPGVVTAPDLDGNVDDFDPTGLADASILRVRTDGGGVRTISGLAGGVAGRELTLINYGSNTDRIELLDSDAGSSAANRFQLDGRIYVGHSQGVVLWYDGDSSVWRVKARSWQTANDGQVEAASAPEYMVRASNMHRHPGHPKAWINFNGEGVIAINDSYNVMGITDNGSGNYTVDFENAFANTQYGLAGSWARAATGGHPSVFASAFSGSAKAVDSIDVRTTQNGNVSSTSDVAEVGLLFVGELA